MDIDTLVGCFAKLDRADELLKELGEKWVAFLESDPYPHWIDAESEPGWQCVYFDFSQLAPADFGVLAGEIAHDLRSALDHLVWREAVEFSGRVLAEKKENVISFPLRRTRANFKDAPVLRYVSKDAAAIMERHQPYKRGKGIGPKALGLLHWFNRMDKHHAIHVSAAATPRYLSTGIFLDYNPAGLLDIIPRLRWGELKRRTEVIRFRFDPAGPEPNMQVKRAPALGISIGEVPRPFRGIEMVQAAHSVRLVVEDFRQLLPRDGR